MLLASDAWFCSYIPNRDRIEGDPYRLLQAMAYKIPVIASRSPIVEETVGKHRLDFCTSSIEGLANAIVKSAEARALTNNITTKAAATFEQRYNAPRATKLMLTAFDTVRMIELQKESNPIDRRVLEIETKVSAKEYLEAVELIENVFALGDVPVYHQANLYRLIGDCFTKLGDADSGRSAYMKSLELDPFTAKAHIGLGTVALTKQSFDGAVMQFQKAVSLSPNDDMASLGLGLAFQGLGELKEAHKWTFNALCINAENTPALFSLVKLAYDRNEFEDVRQALCKFVEVHPYDTNMLYSLAGVEYKTERFSSAEMLLEQLLGLDPTDTRAQQLLAQVRNARGEAHAAQR
jgi:Flp pilus assembly protein TadD